MSSKAATVADYLAELPEDRRAVIARVRDHVNSALPDGYYEVMNWGMICWEVPLEVSGPTYNGQPLGYVALAAQKNYNSLYLIPRDQAGFEQAFAAAGKRLDMGKCCIRFKKADDLALDVIRDEIASTTPDEFIRFCEEARASGTC